MKELRSLQLVDLAVPFNQDTANGLFSSFTNSPLSQTLCFLTLHDTDVDWWEAVPRREKNVMSVHIAGAPKLQGLTIYGIALFQYPEVTRLSVIPDGRIQTVYHWRHSKLFWTAITNIRALRSLNVASTLFEPINHFDPIRLPDIKCTDLSELSFELDGCDKPNHFGSCSVGWIALPVSETDGCYSNG